MEVQTHVAHVDATSLHRTPIFRESSRPPTYATGPLTTNVRRWPAATTMHATSPLSLQPIRTVLVLVKSTCASHQPTSIHLVTAKLPSAQGAR